MTGVSASSGPSTAPGVSELAEVLWRVEAERARAHAVWVPDAYGDLAEWARSAYEERAQAVLASGVVVPVAEVREVEVKVDRVEALMHRLPHAWPTLDVDDVRHALGDGVSADNALRCVIGRRLPAWDGTSDHLDRLLARLAGEVPDTTPPEG